MKIARQFTGGNAQPQSSTASRRDARAHSSATETRSRTRPTLIPARSIDSHLSKTTKGGAAGFLPAQATGKAKEGQPRIQNALTMAMTNAQIRPSSPSVGFDSSQPSRRRRTLHRPSVLHGHAPFCATHLEHLRREAYSAIASPDHVVGSCEAAMRRSALAQDGNQAEAF